jgi:hypothetical protein
MAGTPWVGNTNSLTTKVLKRITNIIAYTSIGAMDPIRPVVELMRMQIHHCPYCLLRRVV